MRKKSNYANRGMELESIILDSNLQYSVKSIATVSKVPTPVKVLKNLPNGKIMGYWEKKSTVDFTGVYDGVAIAFDAKDTKLKNLPLNNIEEHQVKYMVKFHNNGGKAFLIVRFKTENVFYILPIAKLLDYIKSPLKSNKKSIPIRWFEENCRQIEYKNGKLNYLESSE